MTFFPFIDVLTHVAKSVIGIELDSHLVDVVFTMFDVDGGFCSCSMVNITTCV